MALLTRQLERKDERRVQTMLKLSGLPPGKTLEDFDFAFQPRVDRRSGFRDSSVYALPNEVWKFAVRQVTSHARGSTLV